MSKTKYFQCPETQWEHYLANSSFCQVLMAILVVFQNGRHLKYNIIYNFAFDWPIQANLVSKYTRSKNPMEMFSIQIGHHQKCLI